MDALQDLAHWPVDVVSAAVITPDRSPDVVTFGETGRVFSLASVTKLLVAQAALVAVEEGAIELDEPAGPPGSTVAHLLAHASGLAFDSRDAVAEPGTQRIYSSAGYEVLAETVAAATGIAFPDYLREAVSEPLGLTATTLDGPAGHGASSNVDDLSRFVVELLDPTLISPQTAEAAQSVQFAGLDGFTPGYGKYRPNDWGLGPELKGGKDPHWTAPAHSPSTFGHFGQSGTFLWVDPVRRAGAVVLTDRPFGSWSKHRWSETNQRILGELDAEVP